MTRATPPTSRTGDRQFARDVAKHVDRRRLRRRMTIWSALLALIVAAATYLRCGSGFGVGTGTGDNNGAGEGPVRPVAGPKRCAVRVAPGGITVDGKPMSRDEAVEGDWQDLRAALEAAGVKDISLRQPLPRAGSN
jgi:hypothetical protein